MFRLLRVANDKVSVRKRTTIVALLFIMLATIYMVMFGNRAINGSPVLQITWATLGKGEEISITLDNLSAESIVFDKEVATIMRFQGKNEEGKWFDITYDFPRTDPEVYETEVSNCFFCVPPGGKETATIRFRGAMKAYSHAVVSVQLKNGIRGGKPTYFRSFVRLNSELLDQAKFIRLIYDTADWDYNLRRHLRLNCFLDGAQSTRPHRLISNELSIGTRN